MKLLSILEQFLNSEENLPKGDIKKETLFRYWDDKGIDAKPIYHYLTMDFNTLKDYKTIFKYKLEYFGGLDNMIKIFEDRLDIGKPFRHLSGGYEINGVITSFKVHVSKSKLDDKKVYYEINTVINGETSSVTLIETGENYMLDDLWDTNNNLDEWVHSEIDYEISHLLIDYVDSKIHDVLGFKCDTADYNVVSGEEFKKSVE